MLTTNFPPFLAPHIFIHHHHITTQHTNTKITMAQSFWNAASPLISVTEKHPFLVAMVDGSLPLENFQYYVLQDALYLTDFAASLRLMGDRMAGIDAAVSKRLYEFATGADEAEKALHFSFFKEWGIDDCGANAAVMPNTLLYTSYMMRVCGTGSVAEGLAVLLPCFWCVVIDYYLIRHCLRVDLCETCYRI
jgi:thiaminase/transcriptional activator TenA